MVGSSEQNTNTKKKKKNKEKTKPSRQNYGERKLVRALNMTVMMRGSSVWKGGGKKRVR